MLFSEVSLSGWGTAWEDLRVLLTEIALKLFMHEISIRDLVEKVPVVRFAYITGTKCLGQFSYLSRVSELCSSERVRDLQTENRQDECSHSSVAQKCNSTEISLAQMPVFSTSLLPRGS